MIAFTLFFLLSQGQPQQLYPLPPPDAGRLLHPGQLRGRHRLGRAQRGGRGVRGVQAEVRGGDVLLHGSD